MEEVSTRIALPPLTRAHRCSKRRRRRRAEDRERDGWRCGREVRRMTVLFHVPANTELRVCLWRLWSGFRRKSEEGGCLDGEEKEERGKRRRESTVTKC